MRGLCTFVDPSLAHAHQDEAVPAKLAPEMPVFQCLAAGAQIASAHSELAMKYMRAGKA
jgi:hypothetical protein